MPIGVGVFKYVSMKRQTALNTKAPAGAGGSARYQRRVTSTLDMGRGQFSSNEIMRSQQRRDVRLGVKAVSGSLSQELSVGGHQGQFESTLRQLVQANYNSGALTTVTAASSGAGTGRGTYTRAAGDWRTGQTFKVGDVVDVSGWTAPATANNRRVVIALLTATVMTVQTLDGSDVVAKAAGDSVTITLVGKKSWVPTTGHTRDYWTVEHWHADTTVSEVFKDVVFTGFNVGVAPNGMVTVEFPAMGLDMDTGTAEYFTTPAAEPAGGCYSASSAILLVDGVSVGNVTGFSVNLNGNYSAPGGVVGKNTDPDIFPGVIDVTGQLTVLFQDTTLRDKFLAEQVVTVVLVLTDGTSATAPGFTSFVLPKVKLGGHTKDDGQQGITATIPFVALEETAGGAGTEDLATTISVQDSAFV